MADDRDPVETREWLDSLDAVLEFDGPDRATFLLDELIGAACRNGAAVPYSANTPYLNTIPPHREPRYPGDQEVEHALRAMTRWNAVAIVLRANKESSEPRGHIASFQSAATRPSGWRLHRADGVDAAPRFPHAGTAAWTCSTFVRLARP